MVDIEDDVDLFLNNMEPLQEKTLALLIQLHPSMEIMHGLEGLRNILPLLDDRFRYAVELRHHSLTLLPDYTFTNLSGFGINRIQTVSKSAIVNSSNPKTWRAQIVALPNKLDSKFCRMVLTYDAYSETIEEKQQKESEVKELKDKYEQDMKSMREEMNLQFNRIMSMIQQNPQLAYIRPDVLTSKNLKLS